MFNFTYALKTQLELLKVEFTDANAILIFILISTNVFIAQLLAHGTQLHKHVIAPILLKTGMEKHALPVDLVKFLILSQRYVTAFRQELF